MPDRNAIALVKFARVNEAGLGDFLEWWRWDSDYIYHHEDRSDGLDQPYHFSPDDRWIPRQWKVGDVLDCRRGNTLRRTADEGRTWSVRPWAYTMTLVAAFAAYPCGGNIGSAPCIVVQYDNTYSLNPRRGFVEWFWFALEWGWFRWMSFRYGMTPDFLPPKSVGRSMTAAAQADLVARIQRRRQWMLTAGNSFSLLAADTELIDVQFNQLGGQRVTPINPVRPWTEKPEEPEVSTPQPYPSEPDYWQAIVLRDSRADYAEANKPLDDFYPIWSARTGYDIAAGMTKEASWVKHRNEMRVKLGLAPVNPQ